MICVNNRTIILQTDRKLHFPRQILTPMDSRFSISVGLTNIRSHSKHIKLYRTIALLFLKNVRTFISHCYFERINFAIYLRAISSMSIFSTRRSGFPHTLHVLRPECKKISLGTENVAFQVNLQVQYCL